MQTLRFRHLKVKKNCLILLKNSIFLRAHYEKLLIYKESTHNNTFQPSKNAAIRTNYEFLRLGFRNSWHIRAYHGNYFHHARIS